MKKTTRLLTVILALGMMIGIFASFGITVGAAEEGYSGTPATPPTVNADNYIRFGLSADDWNQYDGYYAISNAEELYGFADIVNKRDQSGTGACAILVNDIVVNAGTVTSAGSSDGTTYNWTPIAKDYNNDYNYYKGTFDGRGYTISGLYAGDATAKPVGLFGALGQSGTKATVKNLTIANSYFTGASSVGAIAGHVQGATIANCKVASDVTVSAEDALGGIAGAVAWARMINITSCVNLGKVVGGETGGRNVGAILGNAMENSSTYVKISGCYYIVGNTTANGTNQAGVGNNLTSTDNGTTGIASVTSTHTCVGIEHSEIPATCQAAGTKGYTECMICGAVMSGEKGEIPIGDHAYNSSGECTACGVQAAASLTKGSTVSYYATLEEAITAARSATDSTVTLLDNCSPEVGYWFTISDGKFTLDLNGKQIIVVNSAYSAIVVESGNITLTDSAGGGGSNGGALVRGDGTLRVEGGTYGGKVSTTNGNLIVVGGSFAVVSLDYDENPGTISLMGGKIATLQVRNQQNGKKMSDVIVQDYYLTDENGVLIDPNDAQISGSFYSLNNVTVQRGADLSANAVVTVENAIYNGSKQVPEVTVTVLGRELMMGVDFSFTYPEGYDITNAGTTTLTIKAIGSYYTGETTATYTIEKRTLTESDITLSGLNTTYNLNPQTVSVSLPTGLDAQYVTLVYVDGITAIEGGPTDAGSYKVLVKVEGSPNYENATLEYDMVISPAPVEVYIDPTAEFIFNLNSHTPDIAVEINNGLPFDPTLYGGTVKYENNYNAGTATVTVGGNFVGSTTFTIKKATPQVDLGAPIDTVLGGFIMDVEPTTTAVDKIAESITLTVLDGEGYSVSGNRITIDDGVVIGSTITVLVEYPGSTNYEKTVTEHTLTVGVPAANTAQLENKLAALEELADTKASAAELASAIDELEVLINNAEITAKNYTDGKADELTDAIADAKAEVTTAYTAAINDAKAELKELIDLKADKTTLDNAIDELEALIANAEAAAKAYTDGKADELTDAIADAKAEVTTAYTAAINDAKAELKELIDLKADKTALDNAIDELEALIADAEATAKAYTDGKADELTDAIADAKAELTDAIADAKAEVTTAYTAAINDAKAELKELIDLKADKTALDKAIDELEALIADAEAAAKAYTDGKADELTDALNTAKTELTEAIKAAKTELTEAYTAAIEDAKEELNEAIISGDTALEIKIAELTDALDRARAALKSADQHNKAELEKAIANGDAALAEAIEEAEARIKELENALTNAKFNLNQKDKELDSTVGALTTALIIIGVVAGVGFAGCATLTVMTVISRRKTAGKKDKK